MAIPPEFNDVEHLQSVIRRYINKQVREDFRDLGGDDWEPDVSTTRSAMRYALTHKDNDPLQVTLSRMFLYYFTFRKAQDLQMPMYGIPVHDYQQLFRYHPQIKLFFMEDKDDVEEPFYPVRSEITFRLMGETENTMNEAKARVIANRIKTNFATGSNFRWKRGRETWTYYDTKRGYQFRLLAWNETEAKRVIEQILDIQSHAPDWSEHLRDLTQRKHLKTATVPKTEFVYGKSRRLPREKPVAYVRFRYAELFVWGVPKAITLIDTTGTRKNPLVAA